MTLDDFTTEIRAKHHPALVAFLTAGYPDEKTFVNTLHAASEAGCDVVEVGIPFSDPIADGPVIQAASTAALESGMTLARALELCADAQTTIDSRLVIMSYVNPVLAMGVKMFARRAATTGVQGVILPDVSAEESEPFRAASRAQGIDYIDLLAPTSSPARIQHIARRASGFVYLVSVMGVTGTRGDIPTDLGDFVARVRPATTTPLYVGFGVSTPKQAAAVTRVADGVIIGSALIRRAGAGPGAADRVGSFLAQVRTAIDETTGRDDNVKS